MESLLSFFNVTKPGEIIWEHAVNNKQKLQKVCQSPDIMMIEGDISYLPKTNEVVMVHPPRKNEEQTVQSQEENLYFSEWIEIIIRADKGAKLDFKNPLAITPCLEILKKINKNSTTPIVLNADIVTGPGGCPSIFDGEEFIALCNELYPSAILSLGWMTEYSEEGKYSKELLKEMLDISTAYKGSITFSIRACFTPASHKELQWFLEDADHTITVWNNEIISDELMKWMQNNIHQHKVLYDIDTDPHLPIRS